MIIYKFGIVGKPRLRGKLKLKIFFGEEKNYSWKKINIKVFNFLCKIDRVFKIWSKFILIYKIFLKIQERIGGYVLKK